MRPGRVADRRDRRDVSGDASGGVGLVRRAGADAPRRRELHRTGSVSSPFVVITTDDAAWAEAHMPGTDPAHPPLNGNDDIFIGTNLDAKKVSRDDCGKAGGVGGKG